MHQQFGRSFLLWLVAAAIAGIAGVMAFTLHAEHISGQSLTDSFVDPGGLQGSHTERARKFRLLAHQPDVGVVLIGNSRVQRWDPARIHAATGLETFNAGIVGMPLTDLRAITEWLAQRRSTTGTAMPHIIAVIAPENFTQQTPLPNELNLPNFARRESTMSRIRGHIDRAARLTQLQTLKQAIRALQRSDATAPSHERQGARRDVQAVRGTLPAHTTTATTRFRADGYLEHGAFFGADTLGTAANLRAMFEAQYALFYNTVKQRGGVAHIEPSAQLEVIRMLAAAHRAGDHPTLVLAPLDRALSDQLHPLGRDTYAANVRTWLNTLRSRYSCTVIDYMNPTQFGSARNSFYDGVHPRPALADAMVDHLMSDDPVLRAAAQRAG